MRSAACSGQIPLTFDPAATCRLSVRSGPVTLKVDHSGKSMLLLELKVTSNVTVWADLQFRDSAIGRTVRVHYVCSDTTIAAQVSSHAGRQRRESGGGGGLAGHVAVMCLAWWLSSSEVS